MRYELDRAGDARLTMPREHVQGARGNGAAR
jgi:hypothetical protein